MARIHRKLPPKGTKIGVAFSGGLDTRCAVAWFASEGLEVYSYTADLAQPDEKSCDDIPPVAIEHGAKVARLIDCKESLAREGFIAIQCGAFHLATRQFDGFTGMTMPLLRMRTVRSLDQIARVAGLLLEPDCHADSLLLMGEEPELLPLKPALFRWVTRDLADRGAASIPAGQEEANLRLSFEQMQVKHLQDDLHRIGLAIREAERGRDFAEVRRLGAEKLAISQRLADLRGGGSS